LYYWDLQDTLARRLTHGPIEPVQALKYASEIAAALREVHRLQRGHGAVRPESILVASSGLMLASPPEGSGNRPITDDITGLGALLFEMLTARKPHAMPDRRKLPGNSGLHAACLQLAERCMAATAEAGPDIRKVSTEIRLLLLLARQRRPEPVRIDLPKPAVPAKAVLQTRPEINQPPVIELPGRAPRAAPAEQSLPPTGSRCPKCDGYHVHWSRSRGAFERLLETLGFAPRRCHRCYHRFVDIYGFRARIHM
jgi:hypothetical protein